MNLKMEETLVFVSTRTKEMKRIIKISEEKLEEIVSIVMEQVENLDYYEDADFIDVFFQVFRQWVFEKLGEDYKKYPMSLLLKKYGPNFEKEMGLDDYREYGDDRTFDRYRILDDARNLIKKGKYILPSLKKEEKFTEKYKKALPHIIEHLDYPDYVSLEFVENTPNDVDVKFNVDFVKMLHADKYKSLSKYSMVEKLKNYLTNLLGVEFGNPAYGELSMDTKSMVYVGADEWVKNVLNKTIKKEIKKLPYADGIHSIRFEIYGGYATLKVVFKDSFGYGKRTELLQNIKNYIESLGYNSQMLRIER